MLATKKLIVYIGIPLVALLVVVGIALGLIFYYKDPEASPVSSRKKLVIDHDGGADDAFAVTLSLLNEKYFDGPELVALTTTNGNVNLTQSIINSHRFLALCDRQDIPIYSGAHKALVADMVSDNFYGMDGLGDTGYEAPLTIEIGKKPAAMALIELSEKYEGELIVVAIGPVTNIALAARLDPDFIGRLSQLYVGAGHIYSETHTEPEFNAAMDPEAYYIMADSAAAAKVTVVPFSQVYNSLNVSSEWRKNVLGEIDTPIMEALNSFERISFSKEVSWTQLDPAVASIALHNEIVDEFRYSNNSIILEGESRGINTNDFSSSEPNTRLVYKGNIEQYQKFLFDVYSAELKP
ncbi:inosine-uridine preferring nucleoside hydrolase-like isoform X1 [Spodoptera frugiperda]|uniref:Inosine-uridine preferring nucleoside hydrolase-like isoform X1 n=1 Tax=Spodoptera frugiperda TaxID=7108 RepID=A0A9R0CUQ0_SPOFR|nr:inosine-uridine preferring nucleoside hydrolase-like isoform X1 [Spodoptera frugiperda]XP_035429925.2 inosine-uridine preferring nucleoside hydrolase-like isoform X1 [Spodoptera frugiperda]